MYFNIGLLTSILFFLFYANPTHSQDTISTKIIIDTLGNEIYYLKDKNDHPLGYYSPVFTPVCIDGTCYPIDINIFWDLDGNYAKYTLNYDKILTKNEHLPFSEFDYGLLHRVIADSESALADFTIYELTDPNESKVDGVTGATRPELQGAFVPDALYTSYTLWHLVRKPKSDISNFTINALIQSSQFKYLLKHPQLGGQKLALNYLLKNNQEQNIVSVLSPIIDSTDNELTLTCLQLIPSNLSESSEARYLFSKTYIRTDKPSIKKEILNRWEAYHTITELEIKTITTELGNTSATFNQEINLINSYPNWNEDIYNLLLNKIVATTNMMRKEKIKKLLLSRESEFSRKFKKTVKKELNLY